MKVALLFLVLAVTPKQPWVLHYRCDGLTSEATCHGPEKEKEFSSRNEAIAFAEDHEQFTPLYISHRDKEFSCWWEYAYPEGDTLAKTVDCDTEDNLVARYCSEDGCKEHMTNHEH